MRVEQRRDWCDDGGGTRHLMGHDLRLDLAAAVLADPGSAWVLCRPVRDEAGAIVDFTYDLANDHAVVSMGRGPLVGRSMLEVVPEVGGTVFPRLRQVVDSGRPIESVDKSSSTLAWEWGSRWTALWAGTHGDSLVVQWRDVSDVELTAEAVRESEYRFRALVEHASDVIAIIGVDGTICYTSPSGERLLGKALGGDPAPGLEDLVHPEDLPSARAAMSRLVDADPDEVAVVELRIRHAEGHYLWAEVQATSHLDDPAVAGIVVNWRDVTERRALQEQLTHQALHDPLTGLANRQLFRDHLELGLARLARSGRPLALVFCDIDHFKVVNDTLGHAAGDVLLVGFARRLRGVLRPSDVVGRFGGDEFVVLSEDLSGDAQPESLAQRIQDATSGAYDLDGHEVHVSATMGITVAAKPVAASVLLAEADAALYEAKRRGRSRVEYFDQALRNVVDHRSGVEQGLRLALAQGLFILDYQPICDLDTGRVRCAEALLRWNHPVRGVLLPEHFLAVSEETGLIIGIGDWVLSQACREAQSWVALTDDPPDVCINLSGRQLAHPDVVRHLDRALSSSGIDPRRVHLEVTETVMLTDLDATERTLSEMAARGVNISLDDFGTGYSSLMWLQRLPVDTVKLDRGFLDQAGRAGATPATHTLVRAMVELVHAIGHHVVAEGVESSAQHRIVKDLHCDLAQGYHLGRPAPAPEFARSLVPA